MRLPPELTEAKREHSVCWKKKLKLDLGVDVYVMDCAPVPKDVANSGSEHFQTQVLVAGR